MNSNIPHQKIKDFERKQYIVSGLFLILLMAISILFNSLHLQSVAEEHTRFLSRLIKIGDFREASLILQQARLSSFTKIEYRSNLPGKSFVIPTKAEIFNETGFWHHFSHNTIQVNVESGLSSYHSDEIIYEYNRFGLLGYAVLIWVILNLVSIPQTRFLKRRLIKEFNHELELEKKVAKSEIAQQVRHNLRTPLAALLRIPGKLPATVAKDRELLEIIITQIQDLISKLDDRPSSKLGENLETDIYSSIEQAKREMNTIIPQSVEFKFEIDDIVASALVKHIPFELRSILGNLLTNSLQAMNSKGKILIQVKDLASEISISVSDNGCGIKPENLPKIFDRHFSEGKVSGSGIGLSHAKENIEAWGGTINVESVLGVGTTIIVRLPISDRAPWYLPRLKFNSESKIYVLDDQVSGRALWKLKFDDTQLLKQTKFLSQGVELVSEQGEIANDPDKCTLLFDYDLGAEDTGLKWLQEMPSAATRCLVTGHFDNDEIKTACTEHGFYLVPKSQIAEIPLVIKQ